MFFPFVTKVIVHFEAFMYGDSGKHRKEDLSSSPPLHENIRFPVICVYKAGISPMLLLSGTLFLNLFARAHLVPPLNLTFSTLSSNQEVFLL